jgi:hypothetical protein
MRVARRVDARHGRGLRVERAALAAAVLAALLPGAGGALEPRFDHRESHGPIVELVQAQDAVTARGRTVNTARTAIRAGWGLDVSGEGSELIVAADLSLRSWSDPRDERVLLSSSARYRGYFGSEEWKTFFEAGLWAPIRSRLAAGPLLGLGVIYDFSQDAGVYAGAEFGVAFGQARILSVSGLAGVQLRFAVP